MAILAALPWGHYVLAVLFIIVCVLTMLVVLIQKGRGGGLSGAFGGVGGHSAFGAKTGDVFTWITVGLSAAFLLLAVWLNFVFRKLPVSAAKEPTESVQAVPGEPVTPPAGETPTTPRDGASGETPAPAPPGGTAPPTPAATNGAPPTP